MAQSKPLPAPLPHVTCLMEATVDGKVMVDRWPDPAIAEDEYERIHKLHHADAWLCGRVTMAYFARHQRRPQRQPGRARPVADYRDFILAGQAPSYAVAVDAGAKLRWKSNDVNGDQLIVILSRRAPLPYLAELRAKRISYLIAGRREINFRTAFAKLRAEFGIKRLMVEGGGRINAAVLHAGLIDELSLLLAPAIDGDSATNSLFENQAGRRGGKSHSLKLLKLTRRPSGMLWLQYRVNH